MSLARKSWEAKAGSKRGLGRTWIVDQSRSCSGGSKPLSGSVIQHIFFSEVMSSCIRLGVVTWIFDVVWIRKKVLVVEMFILSICRVNARLLLGRTDAGRWSAKGDYGRIEGRIVRRRIESKEIDEIQDVRVSLKIEFWRRKNYELFGNRWKKSENS